MQRCLWASTGYDHACVRSSLTSVFSHLTMFATFCTVTQVPAVQLSALLLQVLATNSVHTTFQQAYSSSHAIHESMCPGSAPA